MSDEKTGGSVFPTSPIYNGDDEVVKAGPGMTLRDYFAAQALPAVIQDARRHDSTDEEAMALTAYAIADALLKARVQ